MSAQPDLPFGKSKRRALHMNDLIFGLGIFTLLGVAAFFFAWNKTYSDVAVMHHAAQVQQAQLELDAVQAKKAQRDALIESVGYKLRALLSQVDETTNLLTKSYLSLVAVENQVTTLKTNETGILIAKYPDLLSEAIKDFQLIEGARTNLPETLRQLESQRRIDTDLRKAMGSEILPDSLLPYLIDEAWQSAVADQKAISNLQMALSFVVNEAQMRVPLGQPTQNSETLEQAIAASLAREARLFTYRVPPTTSYRYFRQSTPKDYDWIYELLGNPNISVWNKVRDPRVQAAMAPFISRGSWSPGVPGNQNIIVSAQNRRPMSWHGLFTMSAMDSTKFGLQEFVAIATDPRNDRPHWAKPFGAPNWESQPDLVEEAQAMQKILTDLSVYFVGLGQLDQ